MSPIEPILIVLSSATALLAAAGGVRDRLAMLADSRITKRLKIEHEPKPSVETDPRRLNDYLFREVGELSLREFAADAEARDIVGRAIARIDVLLEPSRQQAEGVEGPSQLSAARAALERGDVVGALAQLRLGIELEMRELALGAAVSVSNASAIKVIRRLTFEGLLTPSEGHALSEAVRVANEGIHGSMVEIDVAAAAISRTELALRSRLERVSNESD